MSTVLGLEDAPRLEGLDQLDDPIASSYRSKVIQLESERDQALEELRRRKALLTISLLALAPSAYLCFWAHTIPFWAIGVPVAIAFIASRAAARRNRRFWDVERLLDFYRHRLKCVRHEWMGKGDPGVDLKMPGHLSAPDLDLFGEGSMFELLCDVGTPAGREGLAKWLQAPASPTEAAARQEAIRFLRDRTDLREKLALLREGKASDSSWSALRDWLVGEPVDFPLWSAWTALILSLCMVAAGACWWMGVIPKEGALLAMGIVGTAEGALALLLRPRVKSLLDDHGVPGRKVESLRRLCALVQSESFECRWLRELQQRLTGSLEHIKRLQQMVRLRELRRNEYLFYPLLLIMWTTQWTMRIERWRARRGRELAGWLTDLGEFEALVAIAAYAYENPQNPFPEFVVDGPLFDATEMGHPLLDVRICVRNNLRLGGDLRFLIVTGSNMSGKTTLLRAAGLNAILAWMGAPVCAATLRLSQLQVCASIRIEDSLLSGRSRFYAEAERLKATLDRTTSGPPVFFLIDELFGGTNSADRRVAAEAVIRVLSERHAIGLVTSHDLALAEIAEKQGLRGANVHFSDKPAAEGLSFDYCLRPGKVQHSNALKIISMMGIPLDYAR